MSFVDPEIQALSNFTKMGIKFIKKIEHKHQNKNTMQWNETHPYIDPYAEEKKPFNSQTEEQRVKAEKEYED